jgi:5'-nucleotidase
MAKLSNVAVVLASVAMLSVSTLADTFKLLIVHTNDMHSRFNQTSRLSGLCSDQEAAQDQCFGGFARVSEAVKLARARSKTEKTQSLFLIAGDIYQGTLFYSIYKWKIVAKLTNMLRPDAMERTSSFYFSYPYAM